MPTPLLLLALLVHSLFVNSQPCEHGSVKLTTGTSFFYGAVEICISGTWGSVCNTHWDNQDASVVCRQLGYSPYGAIGPSEVYYFSYTPIHHIYQLNCTGNELTLLDCPHSTAVPSPSQCSVNSDANVFCASVNHSMTDKECVDGTVRLVGGDSEYEGIVQVCVNRAWGSVCGYPGTGWGAEEAAIVCKQLGALTIGFTYGLGKDLGYSNSQVGPILLGFLRCSGKEENLLQCAQNYKNTNDFSGCQSHENNIALICTPRCKNGSIRIMEGNGALYGRVEVCSGEMWGTICSDHWSYEDAAVVCRQLGHSPHGAIAASDSFFTDTWPVAIVQLNCTGQEESLSDCMHSAASATNLCPSSHDSSVICQSNGTISHACETGDLRLIGGKSQNEGRVEVCINGLWGSVCRYNWDSSEVGVVCRQLGFQSLGGQWYDSSVYGEANGAILIGRLYCTGSERNLLECSRDTFAVTEGFCTDHSFDVGIKCEDTCEHNEIRLVGGVKKSEGRVEVCRGGSWGTICSDFWDNEDASVVCSELGYSPYGAIAASGYYTDNVWPFHIVVLNCTGSESSIANCTHSGLDDHSCPDSHDASLVCKDSRHSKRVLCNDGDIRLVHGSTLSEGRLEVCINHQWGTVCSSPNSLPWTSVDSSVVCRQLGHMARGSLFYRTSTQFGEGTGPVFLSNIKCTGLESRLVDCSYTPFHDSTCSHYYDVGIKCEASCVKGTVRLYSESNSYFRSYGRVQVCVNNTWGTICDHFWDERDASVVCRQLGYSPHGASVLLNKYTESTWPMHIKDINCTGSEGLVLDCSHNEISGYECSALHDAGVICQSALLSHAADCQTGEVRLMNGPSEFEGRVEYCINGMWGGVCDRGWDKDGATVVCKQLGIKKGKAHPLLQSYYGPGNGSIGVFSASCDPTLESLSDCILDLLPHGNRQCTRYTEAGVRCEFQCTDGQLDLFGTSHDRIGILRVCVNGSWSRVCSNTDLSTADNSLIAAVACSEMGYPPYGAAAVSGSWYENDFPVLIYDLKCYGNETSLVQCAYTIKQHSSYCPHYYSIYCQRDHFESTANCSENDIRLYGGVNEGVLHLCTNKAWTAVCYNSYWRSQHTRVACKQLGYTAYGNAYSRSVTDDRYPILYSQISCLGTESSLSECSGGVNYLSLEDCTDKAVYLNCEVPCNHGDLRLVGSYYYGLVEVCFGGIWTKICRDSFWDHKDASVICRQLGFSSDGALAVFSKWFFDATRPTFFNGMDCKGDEDHILNCTTDKSALDCVSRTSDANVICPVHGSTYSNCSDGEVKLIHGSTKYEGTVLVCINNAWGSVCDDYWGQEEAQVVCNALGYSAQGAVRLRDSHFGIYEGPIIMRYIFCKGTETSLLQCRHNFKRNIQCQSHYHDAGVRCQPICMDGEVQLIPRGHSLLEGKVEVCVNGTWGSVCSDHWGDEDANVVCRQLGFSGENARSMSGQYATTTTQFYITDVACAGTESVLFDCPGNRSQSSECSSSRESNVNCQALAEVSNCVDGTVRLIGGETALEGRVELCYNHIWGLICPSSWDTRDATVVCRQLGYKTTGAQSSFSFSKGKRVFHISSTHCQGTERSVLECQYYTQSCSYQYDAGVICEALCSHGDVRLKGDARYNSFGRVEVCFSGVWTTVCGRYWGNSEASTVCKQLGYSPYGAVAKSSFYSKQDYNIEHYIMKITCPSDKERLIDCHYTTELSLGSSCYNQEDAGAICQSSSVQPSNCEDYSLKLVGGSSSAEGKILMCLNKVWGAFCGSYLSSTDRGVMCRQLGFQYEGATVYDEQWSHTTDVLLFNDITCYGSEESIKECTVSHFTKATSCGVKSVAGLQCHVCSDGDIRIEPYDSGNELIGRVEVCVNRTWGTICSDFFDGNDASVVCRQLGYSKNGAVPLGSLNYISYFPTHFKDLNCSGNEDSVFECIETRGDGFTCGAANDAAVSCQRDHFINFATCCDGTIRLTGGSGPAKGRTELCYGNSWFGVCRDTWHYRRDAAVKIVCSSLGFSEQKYSSSSGTFLDLPSLPFFPFEFSCKGSERSLLDCRKIPLSCSHSDEYAASECQEICKTGDIRLSGSGYSSQGRVDLCVNGTWGTVCSDSFHISVANVVCRQLGYFPYGSIILPTNLYFSQRFPVHIKHIECLGNESSVWDCSYNTGQQQTNDMGCPYYSDAAVACQEDNHEVSDCKDGEARLSGGSSFLEGRVEICFNKLWGSVCHSIYNYDRYWGSEEGGVVCRQLGHQAVEFKLLYDSYFGHGSLPTIVTGLKCSGNEKNLLECVHKKADALSSCSSSSVVGIICKDACVENSVRLRGSDVANAGRVEVCSNSLWTTICHNMWDVNDARVVCRELGFSEYGVVPVYDCFAESQLAFVNSTINCDGNEESFQNCSRNMSIDDACDTYNDAGVICQTNAVRAGCTNGDLRLKGGAGSHEGRVEICVDETWGSVCSSTWSSVEASVACRSLGFLPFGAKTKYFGSGSGPVLLSDVICDGTEDSLLDCAHHVCSLTHCSRTNDVGIICEIPCMDGDIRLGDNQLTRGRIEVCVNGTWGTICDDQWTDKDAAVVCGQLGYSKLGAMATKGLFIDYEWPVTLTNLSCSGDESSIWSCSYNLSVNELATDNCGQSSDASVFCLSNITEYANCENGLLRLVGGETASEGNVQVCYGNTWGSVCDRNWGTSEADVVCTQLGFQPYGSSSYHSNWFKTAADLPFLVGTFSCSGSETILTECDSSVKDLLYCTGSQIAGVHCEGDCTDGKLRIRGTSDDRLGRLEVCVNGTWSIICKDGWDDLDARVACQQLGYSLFGAQAASGSILVDDFPMRVYNVNCIGSEVGGLFGCDIHLTEKGVHYSRCSDSAGIFCQVFLNDEQFCINGDVRLIGTGTTRKTEGRVEVCVQNSWSTVCHKGWGFHDGNVICGQLGFQKFGSVAQYWSRYGSGDAPIMLSELGCRGSEDSILSCARNVYSVLECSSSTVAGLVCEDLCVDGDIRISRGETFGRVEICVNQTWGTVCDTKWNDEVAAVVCSQLGLSRYGAISTTGGYVNPHIPVNINSFLCTGNETNIEQCVIEYSSKALTLCNPFENAGVICQDSTALYSDCHHGHVRLQGGKTKSEGRVEVCIHGVWSAVCDAQWDSNDADIICSQLGYYPKGSKPRYGSFYGLGSAPLILSHFDCNGREASILDCSRDFYGFTQCGKHREAGVKCVGSFPVQISHSVGSILGGELLFVTGPLFKYNDTITCMFGSVGAPCKYITEEVCVTVIPEAPEVALVQLTITINRNGIFLSGAVNFRYELPLSTGDLNEYARLATNNFFIQQGETFNVSWNNEITSGGLLAINETKIDVYLYVYSKESLKWEEMSLLAEGVDNLIGVVEVQVPTGLQLLDSDDCTAVPSQVVISISPNKELVRNATGSEFLKFLVETKRSLRIMKPFTTQPIFVRGISKNAKKRIACELWHEYDRGVDVLSLPPCPCTEEQAIHDDRFIPETSFINKANKASFKKTGECYTQSSIKSKYPSQQCCYNEHGNIVTGIGGGSAYKVYPIDYSSFVDYLCEDVAPFFLCCTGLFSACNRYYNRRPNDDCSDYPKRFPPARAYGDPHMVTLDGHKYTFNGKGEFTLVESLNDDFLIQVRFTEPNERSEFAGENGTVITALVAQQRGSDVVQFEIINGKLVTFVNGDEVDFSELNELKFRNLTLASKENQTLFATLSSGLSVTVKDSGFLISDVAITLPYEYYRKTQGLMGPFNGDTSDDLLPKGLNVSIPLSSSLRDIHYHFGLTWIIDDPTDSIFTYGVNGAWESFYDPNFTPLFDTSFINKTIADDAEKVCGSDESCLFDVAATGNLLIGIGTKESGQEQDTVTELLKPFICEPPCIHGACVANQSCVCSTGYAGDNCADPVYHGCEIDVCQNGGVCKTLAGDYLCICAEGYSGFFCERGNATNSTEQLNPFTESDYTTLSHQTSNVFMKTHVISTNTIGDMAMSSKTTISSQRVIQQSVTEHESTVYSTAIVTSTSSLGTLLSKNLITTELDLLTKTSTEKPHVSTDLASHEFHATLYEVSHRTVKSSSFSSTVNKGVLAGSSSQKLSSNTIETIIYASDHKDRRTTTSVLVNTMSPIQTSEAKKNSQFSTVGLPSANNPYESSPSLDINERLTQQQTTIPSESNIYSTTNTLATPLSSIDIQKLKSDEQSKVFVSLQEETSAARDSSFDLVETTSKRLLTSISVSPLVSSINGAVHGSNLLTTSDQSLLSPSIAQFHPQSLTVVAVEGDKSKNTSSELQTASVKLLGNASNSNIHNHTVHFFSESHETSLTSIDIRSMETSEPALKGDIFNYYLVVGGASGVLLVLIFTLIAIIILLRWRIKRSHLASKDDIAK